MTLSFAEADTTYDRIIALINAARNDGSIPVALASTIDDLQYAVETEIQKIEEKKLAQRATKYAALTAEIKQNKDTLEKAQQDAKQFIADAAQAQEFIDLAAKLLPLLV